MKILEEELSSIEDQKKQERLAKEYGKLQERYTLLGGYGLEAEAKRILQGLGFKERDFNRATDELSGGWLMRIALAKILLQSPDLLLLDEPTNHLDLESLIWLEEFLIGYPGAIVIASHDRVFLNHLIDRIAEIEAQKIDLYYGDYDHYLQEEEARRQVLEATYKTQARERLGRPKDLSSDSGLRTPNRARFKAESRSLRKLSGLNFRRIRRRFDSTSLLSREAVIKLRRLRTFINVTGKQWSIKELISISTEEIRSPSLVRMEQENQPSSRSWPGFSTMKKARSFWERM